MELANGISTWKVGDAESNARDAIEVGLDRVVWEIDAIGSHGRARIEEEDPKVRRFVMQVLRERRRIGHRRVVHPAPKPMPGARRRRGREMQECPQCGGTGSLDCSVCRGDGWIVQD